MGRVQIRDATLAYQGEEIITNLNLRVEEGELLSLLGPSGGGKTTILKAVAGLLKPQCGQVFINGEDVTNRDADKRDAVLLFQKPLLFPFLNVIENIAFGLRMAKSRASQADTQKKCSAMMDLTGLEGLGNKRPHELSGGQQQRVALARALVLEPSVLLLDEPLSSLDSGLRQQMQSFIRSLQQQLRTTMIFVTHDQNEAFVLSDRVALLLDGKIRQTGAPSTLFHYPIDPGVATFFGNPNLLSGKVAGGLLVTDNFSVPIYSPDRESISATIRPEEIHLSEDRREHTIQARVQSKQFEGPLTRYLVEVCGQTLTCLSLKPDYSIGQNIWTGFPKAKIHIF